MRVAITGAATGIGAEVAAKLGVAGHQVIAFDIAKPSGPIDGWIETDMADSQSIDAALAKAEGPFDALINNAGLPPRPGLEKKILQVNYFGLRRFLNGMLDKMSGEGAIVNTASRAGAMWRDNLDQVKALASMPENDLDAFISTQGIDPTRAYNLSKEAVIVMTLAQTEQLLARGLRMNCVSPAAVSTDILKDFTAAFGERVAKNVARVGRPGSPSEIADVIIFLASSQSAWIKGQDIVIDGGMGAMAITDMLSLNG